MKYKAHSSSSNKQPDVLLPKPKYLFHSMPFILFRKRDVYEMIKNYAYEKLQYLKTCMGITLERDSYEQQQQNRQTHNFLCV